ncbi:MAG: lipopolysaccharide kinase InaA family protein, partial [Gemmataceae bacterium]
DHLTWARSMGLPVPRPVAAGEFRGPWGRLQSFLAVEELYAMIPLNEAIPRAAEQLAPAAFQTWKQRLVRELARLAVELHRHAYFHKDLYLCHFYLPEIQCQSVPPNFTGRIFVIDFHRLGYHPWQQTYFRIKDLAQLDFSTNDVPMLTARDRLRFWKCYREADWQPAGPPRDSLRGWVRWKTQRYQRHEARRRERQRLQLLQKEGA